MQSSPAETSAPQKNSSLGRFFSLSLGYKYDRLFLILLLVSIGLRVLWLDVPNGYGTGGTLIFDEYYYVNTARNLLGWAQGPNPASIPYPNAVHGTDPNQEHPPLAKLMLAASMSILGDNAWGWRLPSVIMGALSILLFYLLMKRISKNGRFSFLASFIFSFDTLIFVDSRVAILDIYTLAFMMLGFYLFALDKRFLSAIALALSTVTKIGGFYGFLTIFIFYFLKDLPRSELAKKWKSVFIQKVKWLGAYTIEYVGASAILFLALDWLEAGHDPIGHIHYIFTYTLALVRPAPTGIESQPLDWLLNQVPIPYLGVSVSSGGLTYPTIAFWGIMNPFIIYLTIPAMAYALYRFDQRNSQLALFLLCWFAATYFPFFPLAYIAHRISYIFYFQNTVPAVAGAIALMFSNKHVPRTVIIVYAILILAGFIWYFPFKKIPP